MREGNPVSFKKSGTIDLFTRAFSRMSLAGELCVFKRGCNEIAGTPQGFIYGLQTDGVHSLRF